MSWNLDVCTHTQPDAGSGVRSAGGQGTRGDGAQPEARAEVSGPQAAPRKTGPWFPNNRTLAGEWLGLRTSRLSTPVTRVSGDHMGHHPLGRWPGSSENSIYPP